ncbi:MAG TPA: ExeM/NucH family extracellular endonuclease [Paucimonas sp.]|nr:ExeM/NucH family extracellular endonuclease [Paucimonas sp.]
MSQDKKKEYINIAFKLGELKQLVRKFAGTATTPDALADQLIAAGVFADTEHSIKFKQFEDAVGQAYDLLIKAYFNEAPVAADDALSMLEDRSVTLSAAQLLANDSDANGDALHIAAIGNVSGGTATLNADGSVTFTATPDFAGTAGFTYQVSDGGKLKSLSNTAHVAIDVKAVNDAPVRTAGGADKLLLTEDAAATPLGLAGVTYGVGGGADEAAQTLTYTVTQLPDAALGKIVLADGVTAVAAGTAYTLEELQGMAFVAAKDANGSASFSYTVRDSGGSANGGVDTLTQAVAIEVQAVNDAPVAANDFLKVADDRTTTFSAAQLLANDSDVEQDAVSIAAVTSGVGGTAVLNADGTVSFTPDAGFTGQASFTYTATDGKENGVGNTATVTVDVVSLISSIQGEGAISSRAGQTVLVEARVTAWAPDMKTFWVQEESTDQDGNVKTSEGIAVFYGNNPAPITADNIGDIVRFNATVTEYKASGQPAGAGSLTELINLANFTVVTDGTKADLDPAVKVTLPVATDGLLEQYEGMLVEIGAASGGKLYASDINTFGRFGEVVFQADAVAVQYTQTHLPSASGNAAHLDFLARNSIQLEDRSTTSNPTLEALQIGSMLKRDGADLSKDNFLRIGDAADSLTGILSFDRGLYELQPAEIINLTGNARTAGPDEAAINANGSAEIRVASMNVLNYFTSLSIAGTTSDNFPTPYGNVMEPRGANTAAEFARQQAKVIEAILGTNADVLGLMEMQNNGFGDGTSAIDHLVDALNARVGAGTYAYVKAPYNDGDGVFEPTAGTDAIHSVIIYKTDVVKPLGQASTPDVDVYTAFTRGNRVPVAQTFSYLADETKQFTLVVNHLRSKGSGTLRFSGDADQGDGQGGFNSSRLEAAVQLSQWLATNPTGATDGDYLLVGDFNAYAMEDPIRFLTGNEFNASAVYGGYDIPTAAEALAGRYNYLGSVDDYSYMFGGMRGSLDHALASSGLLGEITGVTHWHNNSDESTLLDYNTEFKTTDLFSADPYRASDHDPVIIGLKLGSEAGSPVPPPADTVAPTLRASTPADNAVAVAPGADIVLSFNEQIRAGSGAIVLKGLDGAADVTIDVNSSQVSISGDTLTINPSADLAAGKRYAVQIAAGAIEDLAGNDFAGIADTTTVDFTTAAAVAATVRISEIHYDNAGADTGETIALSGIAGTSLQGWSLVLYNGNDGKVYNTKALSGTIDDEGNGWGEVAFAYPADGIQNGSPDAVALIDGSGKVVQFLSYEGSFTAVNGPAVGMVSTDIMAAESSSTAIGMSLQLIGNSWQAGTSSFGMLNAGFAGF